MPVSGTARYFAVDEEIDLTRDVGGGGRGRWALTFPHYFLLTIVASPYVKGDLCCE
jgi:hypothetical protein